MKKINNVIKPIFFDLTTTAQKYQFFSLLAANPSIQRLDEIDGQLAELIKLRNPKKKLTSTEMVQEIEAHLGKTTKENYGVWVYYPWLNKIIHLLNEKEFVEVRTNRNQYKITPKEEAILATKKIGIIGLSVGKAIAITIALERICGELVLADFDVIELSNLNRIQTGVKNLGVKKTTVVAREIAEIDPYLKVSCYQEGFTEENATDFFTKNGKIDICIEVCDGLPTKIVARQKAKEFGIPVVMETNDRGMVDIERFDLEPERPIFHGLTDHLAISNIKQVQTNEEKLSFINAIVDFSNSSVRLKESLTEIGKSILTWPQLASDVALGGAVLTHVCRRILLNDSILSGRYFIDLYELFKKDAINHHQQTTLDAK
ncbi:MAG: hypothetical protein COX70_08725 [Flavobacteriales bacterium CG_4_10_14_0_2_um_filter_32_8]|nr:MAG: hypothetical protein COX70_08725 [Flavobacteriales bacterium CG_4_10_14_0_2_um_filter_32_8]PJB15685.1 MAG: hypothetical protein CO118_02595 [Flavobacteriales bacterium CG_4_9_14_3_um_filter_32_8]